MSGEITLDATLERVESSGLKERGESLKDLKHVLRNNARLETLSDIAFHRIYEVLFGITISEQSTWSKAKTATTRTAAENRLFGCSSTLRLAVEVGIRCLRLKTVRSVLDHVIDTTILRNGQFCEPIALDYMKCLSALLDYQPHVEHLTKEDRESIATFCIKCIETAQSTTDEDDASPGAELLSTTGTVNGLSYRSSRSNLNQSGGSQGSRTLARSMAEATVTCLSLLTSAPNSAPGSGASDLLSALITLLQRGSIAGGSRQDAFAAINHILAWVRSEATEVTRKVTSSLVRLIRNCWTLKTSYDKALASFRDEMLITLIHLQPYILAILQEGDRFTLRAELVGLFEVMRKEYGRRSERDQLRLEDIGLTPTISGTPAYGSIELGFFRLRCAKGRAESCWTIAQVLASLTNALMGTKSGDAPSDSDGEDDDISDRPRKRQRMNDDFDEILVSSASGSVAGRVCALQILALLGQQRSLDAKQLIRMVDKLSASYGDDNGLISSWAMLGLASCASQLTSTKPSLLSRWVSIWQVVMRAVSNVSTCRAACHVIHVLIKAHLVPQQLVTEMVQTMTSSMDLNGPTVLADSVLHLMCFGIKASQEISLAASNATADSILGWLFRNFRPSKLTDREYAGQHSLLEAEHVIELISCCLGQPTHIEQSRQFPIWEALGQAWLQCATQQPLVAYLLLLPKQSATTHSNIIGGKTTAMMLSSRPSCEAVTLNHFTNELHKAHEEWSQLMHQKPQGISTDVFMSHCNSCFIATCIAFCNTFKDSRRQTQLQRQTKEVLRSLTDFIASQHCTQEKADAMLTVFSSACPGLFASGGQTEHPCCEKHICHAISRAVAARAANRNFNDYEGHEDEMDVDAADESQASSRTSTPAEVFNLQGEYAVKFSTMAMRASIMTYATAINAMDRSGEDNEHGHEDPASAIADYVLSLSEASLIFSQGVITSMSDIGVELTVDDCSRLFDRCADQILPSYKYERNEVALSAILDMMTSFTPVLTDKNNGALYECGIDIYSWYTSTALKAGVLSPAAQERVAGLLLRICHVDTDYGRNDERNVPSVRTSLFKLVQLGSIRVQFALATRISTIFGLFVLSTHSAMFEDFQLSLPEDSEWLEGMAMRLLFYARLGAAWHSLLRHCVYYIFEAAGRIEKASKHASRGMQDLAMALNFDTPQRLFDLFSPQLLNTWLLHNQLSSLPFAVVDYPSLQALIERNQSEIVAQLLINGKDSAIQSMAVSINTSGKDLVTRNFARCEAYCLGRDIANSAGSGSNDATCENRHRRLMESKEDHRMFVNTHFAAIMGHLYLSLQQDDPQDHWLDKRSGCTAAASALSEMKKYCHSDRDLSSAQDPSFKNKYLCDEIERLCRRTSLDPFKPWDASSFSLAARMLLDSIEHALGPLHTCQTIRKLRLLICMAGDVAFSGFPLEMLVHTLRPFLADSQCADDVIGVLQYLFVHGQQHLQTSMPFLHGTVILMILQMRKHSTARDSTTQESQHKSTVQKMEKFQSWLVKYLQSCQSANGGSPDAKTYADVTKSLSTINLPGNAHRGSPESTLLLFLMEEDGAAGESIREMDRREALTLLSDQFDIPSSTLEDCLGHDPECAKLTQALFNVLQIVELGDSFRAWAANGLGRAYAYTGIRPITTPDIRQRSLSRRYNRHDGVTRSQATIAARLAEKLFSRDRAEASLADHTLRSILTTFANEEEFIAFQQMLPPSVVIALSGGTHGYQPFHTLNLDANVPSLRQVLEPSSSTSLDTWAKNFSLVLCQHASDIVILPALMVVLEKSAKLALEFLPCIIHMLLVHEFEKDAVLRAELSKSIAAHLTDDGGKLLRKQRFLIELILYLRKQPVPGERTHGDRLRWLELDWLSASEAAQRCGMSTAALLFAETSSSQPLGGRRTSSRASLTQISLSQIPQDLMLSIFRDVEEPDSFYGVGQVPTLESVLHRLDYEADGYKSLMFRSAQADTQLRSAHQISPTDSAGIIRSLSMLNLNSLTFALLTSGVDPANSTEQFLDTARQLQRWDVVPSSNSAGATANSFAAFQELSRASDRQTLQSRLRAITYKHIESIVDADRTKRVPHSWFGHLASFTEINEIVACNAREDFLSRWAQMLDRQSWMSQGTCEDYQLVLSNRQTLFSVLAEKSQILAEMHIGLKDCRLVESKALLDVSRFARRHGQLQLALTTANQCKVLTEDGQDVVFRAEAAAQAEIASVLWDMGEVTASISMLQSVCALTNLEHQDIPVGKSGLLAQLAHQLAEARLERPDDILANYLKPAISQLQGESSGREAGKVYHEFARFCDKQLQNPSDVEDFKRIESLRQKKLEEYQDLVKLSKSTSRSAQVNDNHINKAKLWYDIDDADYKRLKQTRDTFMEQSLQNYLLALGASDEHDISILRFYTLWLENSNVANADKIVHKYLSSVPSWKFVVLLNQLMSRLEQGGSPFQTALKNLVMRLCAEHPHHSLHHLYSATRPPKGKDEAAISRFRVATEIRGQIKQHPRKAELLDSVFAADKLYETLANKNFSKEPASKMAVKDIPEASGLAKKVQTLHVPPPTANIPLQPDGDYATVPVITKFLPTLSLMAGNSRPKRLTAVASDGRLYVQLFKGPPGLDDLRQDAIMEQVFVEVSKMLRNHKATRQRGLHVRTYKVIPLSHPTGIIEFVPNSIAFTTFLEDAHLRYHPQDYRLKQARQKIADVAKNPTETRVREYQKVCDRLHPVLRHFFFERFKDPDEWFEKRTAYTRTTATISILGYVLGLGDRHCQNIMLDEKTGEVVHIDLGIAFEAGRVLPIPELVPFRLTRDVVDGMGITKTEGVFRRCCEFTMDALREDKDSIMTLLNVLRYDPLYNWTLSPLRAKRMQEASGRVATEIDVGEVSSKKREQEVGEADRALSVVEKKLSKSLSTAATVNELIQQATDVKNLATLFVGWSAFF